MNFLYVATDGNLFKIGISGCPERRVSEHGRNVRLVEKWQRDYAPELEWVIKGLLSYCCTKGSEWFAITEAEMMFQVRRAVRIYDDDFAIANGLEPSKRDLMSGPQVAKHFGVNTPTIYQHYRLNRSRRGPRFIRKTKPK